MSPRNIINFLIASFIVVGLLVVNTALPQPAAGVYHPAQTATAISEVAQQAMAAEPKADATEEGRTPSFALADASGKPLFRFQGIVMGGGDARVPIWDISSSILPTDTLTAVIDSPEKEPITKTLKLENKPYPGTVVERAYGIKGSAVAWKFYYQGKLLVSYAVPVRSAPHQLGWQPLDNPRNCSWTGWVFQDPGIIIRENGEVIYFVWLPKNAAYGPVSFKTGWHTVKISSMGNDNGAPDDWSKWTDERGWLESTFYSDCDTTTTPTPTTTSTPTSTPTTTATPVIPPGTQAYTLYLSLIANQPYSPPPTATPTPLNDCKVLDAPGQEVRTDANGQRYIKPSRGAQVLLKALSLTGDNSLLSIWKGDAQLSANNEYSFRANPGKATYVAKFNGQTPLPACTIRVEVSGGGDNPTATPPPPPPTETPRPTDVPTPPPPTQPPAIAEQ